MQKRMFSIRRVTLIAFMMLGIASHSVIVSCNKEQTKPDKLNLNLKTENSTDEILVSKQPCTPEEL